MHPDINLIAKFTDITSFPTHAHPSYNSYTSSDARRAVANEIHIFLGPLKILQGHIVPRFLGMVGSLQSDGAEVWCAVFGDVGRTLPKEQRCDPLIR